MRIGQRVWQEIGVDSRTVRRFGTVGTIIPGSAADMVLVAWDTGSQGIGPEEAVIRAKTGIGSKVFTWENSLSLYPWP